jgi:hypothetical protein
VGLFFGRRETLNEQLIREAGLGPERDGRRSVRKLLVFRPISTPRPKRRPVTEQEAARSREPFRLKADDRPPPGFG